MDVFLIVHFEEDGTPTGQMLQTMFQNRQLGRFSIPDTETQTLGMEEFLEDTVGIDTQKISKIEFVDYSGRTVPVTDKWRNASVHLLPSVPVGQEAASSDVLILITVTGKNLFGIPDQQDDLVPMSKWREEAAGYDSDEETFCSQVQVPLPSYSCCSNFPVDRVPVKMGPAPVGACFHSVALRGSPCPGCICSKVSQSLQRHFSPLEFNGFQQCIPSWEIAFNEEGTNFAVLWDSAKSPPGWKFEHSTFNTFVVYQGHYQTVKNRTMEYTDPGFVTDEFLQEEKEKNMYPTFQDTWFVFGVKRWTEEKIHHLKPAYFDREGQKHFLKPGAIRGIMFAVYDTFNLGMCEIAKDKLTKHGYPEIVVAPLMEFTDSWTVWWDRWKEKHQEYEKEQEEKRIRETSAVEKRKKEELEYWNQVNEDMKRLEKETELLKELRKNSGVSTRTTGIKFRLKK